MQVPSAASLLNAYCRSMRSQEVIYVIVLLLPFLFILVYEILYQ
jgi:hypothetical protein